MCKHLKSVIVTFESRLNSDSLRAGNNAALCNLFTQIDIYSCLTVHGSTTKLPMFIFSVWERRMLIMSIFWVSLLPLIYLGTSTTLISCVWNFRRVSFLLRRHKKYELTTVQSSVKMAYILHIFHSHVSYLYGIKHYETTLYVHILPKTIHTALKLSNVTEESCVSFLSDAGCFWIFASIKNVNATSYLCMAFLNLNAYLRRCKRHDATKIFLIVTTLCPL